MNPPTIIIDSREQEPLRFVNLPTAIAGLYSGDYSIFGAEALFAVERKSIPDLVGCCCDSNRARFEHELHRLRGFRFKRLIIVGTLEDIMAGNYRSAIAPQAVIGTLAAFEVRYDIPVVFAPTPADAARQIETWAWYFARECLKVADAISPKPREPKRGGQTASPACQNPEEGKSP